MKQSSLLKETLDVISDFKNDFRDDEIKKFLWEWYKHTVNGSFNTSTTREEREIITSIYERIDELIKALYQERYDGK
jgi:hypothetical protein